MAPGHVVVVGGGLAGLSAAVELKRQGCRVELIERSRLLGGKATSFTVDGIEVDNGQHVILGCCTEFIDFVRDLEMDTGPDGNPALPRPALAMQQQFEALLLSSGEPAARLRARDLPAPLHLAPALLAYRHLSLSGRLRVAWALARARDDPKPEETFDAWLRRHGQTDETFRAFWLPFFVPALNAPLDQVAATAGLFVIVTAFLQRADYTSFGFSRVPLAHIAATAAARLDTVRLRTPAVGLATDNTANGRPALRGIVLDGGEIVNCDAAVLAIPPDRASRLVGEPARFGIPPLHGFEHAPIVDAHIWYDIDNFGFSFAALLDSPVQWVFVKAPGYLNCSMSAAEQYVSMSNDNLIELAHSELVRVLPPLARAHRLRAAATRDREATFVPVPGLRRPGPATSCPQLALAGAWTDTGWPATMESAVRSGRSAARLLMENVR